MDPAACLERFFDECRAGDREGAINALLCLTEWIEKGGFLPAPPNVCLSAERWQQRND